MRDWEMTSTGAVRAVRDAEFWHGRKGGNIACDLCYRPGRTGAPRGTGPLSRVGSVRINCGGLLLQLHVTDCEEPMCRMFLPESCDCRSHTQHATGGGCDHCGAAVPVVTLPMGG